ncbi:corticosteroid- binding protein [Branchiostoma belcheri]|nr:corticosteroid- binding protein [Branchiostoma belcheri]
MASLRVLLCLSAFVFGCSTLSRDHIAWDEDLDTHIAWDEDLDTDIAWDEDLDTEIAWPWDEDLDTDIARPWDEDLDTDIAWPWDEDLDTEIAWPWDEDLDTDIARPWDEDLDTDIARPWDEDLDTDIAWPWDEDLDTHIAWDEDLDTMCRWVRKDQDQELRVILRNSTLESIIDNIRLDVSDFTQLRDWGPLHPDTTDVAYLVVGPSIADEIQDLLHKYGVYFQVRMRDLRQLIQEHLCVNQQLAEEDKAGEFNFARYHPYDEILQYLTDTAGRYPNLATLVDVANTSEGRSVVALKIGVPKKTPKRAVWIDAGIHAREWIAPATAVYFIQQLVTRYGRDQTVTDLLEKLDWYVVPVVNVDGYIYTWSDTETPSSELLTGVLLLAAICSRKGETYIGGEKQNCSQKL